MKEVLSEDFMCPAAGQGALGIEIRAGDVEMREHLAFLDDADARAATTCERALLNKLGRRLPGADRRVCRKRDGSLRLTAIVARPTDRILARTAERQRSDRAGRAVGETLLRRGATRF